MHKTKFDNRIRELMNLARTGKITVGEFTKRAGEHYDVELHELTQTPLCDAANSLYLMKQSQLSFGEYFKRINEIINALVTLETECISERYVQIHALSGRLTV